MTTCSAVAGRGVSVSGGNPKMNVEDLAVGWRARPYVTGVVGTANEDVEHWTEWEHGRTWAAESFATSEWVFPVVEPSQIWAWDARVYDHVATVNRVRYTEDEDLGSGDIAAIEGLARWCVGKVLTYPVRIGDSVQHLVGSYEYTWEVWEAIVGSRWAVMGFAMPVLSQPMLSRNESRADAAVWMRRTFGPAFLPASTSGWSCVERGTADKARFTWGWGRSEKDWGSPPASWSAWG